MSERDDAARKRWAWRIVRALVTVGALAWVLSRVDLRAVGAAVLRVPVTAMLAAAALSLVNLGVGTLRWRALLAAYGAPRLPGLALLYRLNLIGYFYNTWLPGGVGGDVVRAVASRAAFGEGGTTGAVAVVLVERVLGLVGLLLLVGTTSLVWPLAGIQGVGVGASLGVAAGAGAVLTVALGRSLAPRLPRSLARLAERLPRIERPAPFALALGLSLVTQSIVALSGHLFVSALAPSIPLSTSAVIVPLSMATAYLPFTAGGAGAREAAFQELFSRVGVSYEDATAASLLLAAVAYVVAALGGVLPIPAVAEAPAEPARRGG